MRIMNENSSVCELITGNPTWRQKIRSMVSAYVDSNKKIFSGNKFAVKVKNRYPQFNKYYEDELKFKILIHEKEDWEKFTTILDICMESRPPFKHQKYNTKVGPANGPAK